MSPDADDLLLFARVAESGSFSRAAERVQLPKSTVSRRIAALEKRLGERLLQRTTRKLVITEFGQGVLDHARAMSEEVDAALAFALSRQARPSGRLRVSMPGDFASNALERSLAQFIRDFPQVSLELDLSPRRVDLIGENFDLAIRMGTLPDDSQLAARRLAVFTTGLYAAPSLLREHGEPLAPEALHTMPALMLLSRSGDAVAWELSRREAGHGAVAEEQRGAARAGAGAGDGASASADGNGNGTSRGDGNGNGRSDSDAGASKATGPGTSTSGRVNAHGNGHASASKASRAHRGADAPMHEIVPSQHTRANSPDVLIRLARSGAGVVAVADFFAEPYLARGELQRILPDWCLPDAQCWAVFPGRRLMPAKTRAFIDMLAKAMSTCSEAIDASAAKVDAPPGRFRVD
ncbi:MAG: LysR substrate-binding domain-containing protein [Burkholderiaceae bacterium]